MSDDLKWHENTAFIVKKAYQRMSILHNLYGFNLPVLELIDVYILYISSVIEQSSVVWNSSITQQECIEIERIQKVALRIILKENYVSYTHAICITGLLTLKDRREHLSRKFAEKCHTCRNSEICSLSYPYHAKRTEQHIPIVSML